MIKERVEEYLGAIYRLRADEVTPLPLSRLTEYFGFSPVSIHEMIQKLDDRGFLTYHPYRGVTLTERGEAAAQALLRRHRLWERFLTDVLDLPWDDAHVIAGRLEHAATELVTERLAEFLGKPDSCPHGAPIPPQGQALSEQCLTTLSEGIEARVTRIASETSDLLRYVQTWGLMPGARLRVIAQQEDLTRLMVMTESDAIQMVNVPAEYAGLIWVGMV